MSRNDPGMHAAYVLHARPYRESSLLLELLVHGMGRVGAVARGVRGAKSGARRAALQPLQPLHVGLQCRGELALLTHCEAASQPLAIRGDALLAALYVNELCQRLLPRDEPVDELFLRYASCLAELAEGGVLAAPLRRIEWALLEATGYGIDVSRDAAGSALQEDARYWLDEHGALLRRPVEARPTVAGATLLALVAGETLPAGSEALALRRLLRDRLSAVLGPRPLRCWGVLDELAELRRVDPAQSGAPRASSAAQAASKD
ncbi:DNA repair protein RecO [Pseudomarimonas salicorniae]|uniref:DNA repair protein RecO n=1 Tax=Pseudomarimonas salicorniae TaxID=2933270 RepID=A0ABT0GJT1_9GAMM|nr:DNA repair protein RecO [Lysobacter sp. CAU 1642]MCK7594802.1 DNA repair protein RecO [Lysobacter sp. CAU 1642]